MKFRLKFEYSFNSIDKKIYTYKLEQVKNAMNHKQYIDIREESKKIIYEIFEWSLSSKVEILIHKNEKCSSQNLYIYIYLVINKNRYKDLKNNILSKKKHLIDITKEEYSLNLDYLKNNYKKIVICYIENIFRRNNYEQLGYFFIREPLNSDFFNDYKKDDFKFTENKNLKDMHTNTKLYLAYEFPNGDKDYIDEIKLDKIDNKEKYFLMICYITYRSGILYFTECETNRKNVKILKEKRNFYEIYHKKFLTKINLFPTKDAIKVFDLDVNVVCGPINFKNCILIRYPYFILTKSFYVFPFLTKNIINIFNNYNQIFCNSIGSQINSYLIFNLNDVHLIGYEGNKLNYFLNSLEDDEKDLVAENIYNIITSIEEGNFFISNSNYQVKLNSLFNLNKKKETNNNIDIYSLKSINFFFDILEKRKNLNIKKEEISNEIEEHSFIIQLIEFYLFVKTLNLHEKEKDIKTIETDTSLKVDEEKNSDSEVENSLTDQFINKLLENIERKEKDLNEANNFWQNTGAPIIREFDESDIKKKKFSFAYGKHDTKPAEDRMRRQREQTVMLNANKLEINNYDQNVIKTNFNSNKSFFIMETGKEGLLKDIAKNIEKK